MRYMTQTKFGEYNNSLSTCLVCLLNSEERNILDFVDVPNFVESVDWYKELIRWCEKFGLYVFQTEKYHPEFRGISIAIGKSPRGNWLHSMLWQGDHILWDPHPDKAGILLKPIFQLLFTSHTYA